MGVESKGQPAELSQGFVFKDWAIFVPTLTTALALAWQVGALVPTGGFEYFSISDHLVAAAKALPFALSISSAVSMTYVVYFLGPYRPQSTFDLVGKLIGVYVAFPFLVIFYALTFYGVEVPGLFLMLTLILVVIGAWLLNRRSVDKGLLLFFVFMGLTMLSTALAVDLTLWRLWRVDGGRTPLATITTKSGATKGYVVMAGERGFLVYNSPRSTTFVRSDEVLMINYQR
ncbi:hypothetical protein AB4Z51_28235 [Bradyrhizobium sp. 2TAF36]|uniref:hypothetical protein n=1 Tax=Bradyrhizobium sp. 2TAF36 TaxID=3233016 RepID=UPI003F915121